ncbi:hypothetical protein [Streptomyces sp. NPDC048248]|uniref:hypothetical protein n=1 Tax=Streptomyces sp. NPDC048248 TaxID=3365523 RepID=UPI00371F66E8
MESAPPSYTNHRRPVQVIAHCVWLYFRFPPAFRQVEELMLQRGVTVSYGAVRRWCLGLGLGREAQCAQRAAPFDDGKHLSGNWSRQHGGAVSVFAL